MKKLVTLILTIAFTAVMTAGLAACESSPGPSETTDAFLQAMKEKDTETIKTVYTGDMPTFLDSDEINALDDFTREMVEALLPKALDFDYEIQEETINDDKAEVKVKLSTYELGDAFLEVYEKFFLTAYAAYGDDALEMDDAEMEAGLSELFNEALDKLKHKDYEQTVTLFLTEKDGKWKVDEIDSESDFYNAFLGGFNEAMEDM